MASRMALRCGAGRRQHTRAPALAVAKLPCNAACAVRAVLQVLAARKEREAAVAKAQMDAALSGGASWGMAEDAYDPDADGESS